MFKRKRRAHVVTAKGAPVKRQDRIEEIIRPHRPKKKSSFWRRFWRLALGCIILYGIVLGFKALSAINLITVKNESGSSPLLRLPRLNPNALAGEGDGRINLLIIGVGGSSHPGGALADTIMVASLDPKNKTLALLSIPRDLRVNYPKPYSGQDKINAVHSYGENNSKKIQGGGPALLKKTVAEVLDLPIHYFIRVDFEGFKKIVDALGGVTINVEKPINDPLFPAPNLRDYQPFKIAAGTQKMNGDTALKYSRSRESTSDFDRARRQQQVLAAIKDKSLSIGVLTNPKKVLDIISIIGQHIRTDIQPNEFERLISMIRDVDTSKIASRVLDNSPEGPLMSINEGGYYLVPKTGNYKEIQRIAHEIFSDPLLVSEKAVIDIQNATGQTGLAKELSTDLQKLNYTVGKIETSASIEPKTKIYDVGKGKNSVTTELLKKRISAPVLTNVPTSVLELSPKADIIILLGEDYSGTDKTKSKSNL